MPKEKELFNIKCYVLVSAVIAKNADLTVCSQKQTLKLAVYRVLHKSIL